MIKASEIISCRQITVLNDDPGSIEFSVSTEIYDGESKSVVVRITSPKVQDNLILIESVVTVFGDNQERIETPASWLPSRELESTLRMVIDANILGAPVEQTEVEYRTDRAVSQIKSNIDLAAEFMARTLFFYMKGLDQDSIDRAKVMVFDRMTQKIIHYREKTREHARRKQSSR